MHIILQYGEGTSAAVVTNAQAACVAADSPATRTVPPGVPLPPGTQPQVRQPAAVAPAVEAVAAAPAQQQAGGFVPPQDSQWVQCELCSKWRQLKLGHANWEQLRGAWYCQCNPDPAHKHPQDPAALAFDAGEVSYVVEGLVAQRRCGGKRQFLVRWFGYGRADDTWEDEENSAPLPAPTTLTPARAYGSAACGSPRPGAGPPV